MAYTKEEKFRVVKLFLDGIIEYPPDTTPRQKTNIREVSVVDTNTLGVFVMLFCCILKNGI